MSGHLSGVNVYNLNDTLIREGEKEKREKRNGPIIDP